MQRVTRNRYEVKYESNTLSLNFPFVYAKTEKAALLWVKDVFPSIEEEKVKISMLSKQLKVSKTLVCDP